MDGEVRSVGIEAWCSIWSLRSSKGLFASMEPHSSKRMPQAKEHDNDSQPNKEVPTVNRQLQEGLEKYEGLPPDCRRPERQ